MTLSILGFGQEPGFRNCNRRHQGYRGGVRRSRGSGTNQSVTWEQIGSGASFGSPLPTRGRAASEGFRTSPRDRAEPISAMPTSL
jgi:hypothetical protein